MPNNKKTSMSSSLNDWNVVFDKELEHLGKEKDPDAILSGLCLSGGGVRSAIFCGGVVDYLHDEGLLKEFDYLSTVSGGGYTGAAVSYWGPNVDDKGKDSYIRHLRANVSYLMPSGFKGAMIGSFVVLRSILLNLFIWIGLAAVFLRLVLEIDFLKDEVAGTGSDGEAGLTAVLGPLWVKVRDYVPNNDVFESASYIGIVSLVALALLIPIFSLGTFIKNQSGYMWRKSVEWAGFVCVLGILVGLPFGLLPTVSDHIGDIFRWLNEQKSGSNSATLTVGTVGAIIGTATSIFGLFRARLGGVFGAFSGATIIVGAVILILSAALIAMHIAMTFGPKAVLWLGLASGILAVFCNINDVSLGRFYRDRLMEAFLPNVKLITESGENGNPLARNGNTTAEEADKVRLTQLSKAPHYENRLIHLINANVMSWWAPDSRAIRRKGDNFVLSPLYCGSDMTKWKPTENVANGRITLATAMAVSGAAVNPQGGFAGQGPTTSSAVSLAMAFLSLRLGYWLKWGHMKFLGFIPHPQHFGNHLNPGFWQMLKRFRHEWFKSQKKWGNPAEQAPNYLELSDGGHFDNLGLYELLRRQCRLIVVCDGGHDPENSYEALSVLIRRAWEDFGTEIKFDVEFNPKWSRRKTHDGKLLLETGPQDLVARPALNEYPRETDFAEKGYFLASVTYGESGLNPGDDGYRAARTSTQGSPRKGIIIYMKSALIRDVDLATRGYRGSNPLFPFDPTSNQFFSPEQYEAYRNLGKKIAEQMGEDLVFGTLFKDVMEGPNTADIHAELEGLKLFK